MGKLEAGLSEARHLMWLVWKAYLIFPAQKLRKLAVTDHSGSAFFSHTWSGHGLFMYSFSHTSYRICPPVYNIIFQDPFLFLPCYRFQRNPSSAWQPNSLEPWYPRWERTCSPLVISWGGLGELRTALLRATPRPDGEVTQSESMDIALCSPSPVKRKAPSTRVTRCESRPWGLIHSSNSYWVPTTLLGPCAGHPAKQTISQPSWSSRPVEREKIIV